MRYSDRNNYEAVSTLLLSGAAGKIASMATLEN